jgi:peptidoglycan/LPS O-acetylase OafA/YrhL
MIKEERVFFTGINGLRFIAALAVIITHIELLKGVFGFKSYWKNPLIFNLGGLGVYFFFVLSGFLITYLLLIEKEKFKTIKIKEFYLRRILRIWPLYYLIIIIGFFVLPHFPEIHIPYLQDSFIKNFDNNLLLYIFILPNLAYSMYLAVPHIGHIWSIGVEEQFYLIWPWLIFKTKNVLKLLIRLIIGIIAFKILILIASVFLGGEYWFESLKRMVAMCKFECMAIGGIGACLLQKKETKILYFFYKKITLNISLLLIPILIFFTPNIIQDGIHIIYSILFLIVILNVIGNKNIKVKMDNKVFDFLGKISYGLYMYHFMIIPIILFFIHKLNLTTNDYFLNFIIYLSVIIVTILISALSFYIFENKFIKLKSKFSPIKSGTSNE